MAEMLYTQEENMDVTALTLLAVGLSMDAFAVAVCKGLAMQRLDWRKAGIIGLWFGGFQALMPMLGYFLGSRFSAYITAVDHWIAFGLLVIIGGNMVREACSQEEEQADESIAVGTMLVLAVATSIDALAVGITLAFLQVDIFSAASYIGIATFCLSVLGVKVGNLFGCRWRARAELAGGIILILLGTRILLEHLGIF